MSGNIKMVITFEIPQSSVDELVLCMMSGKVLTSDIVSNLDLKVDFSRGGISNEAVNAQVINFMKDNLANIQPLSTDMLASIAKQIKSDDL